MRLPLQKKTSPMDKIIINRLRVVTIIGTLAHERVNPQMILISAIIFTNKRNPGMNDDINNCLDYSVLVNSITDLARAAQRFTIEALAEDISNLCLTYPKVMKVRIRIEKPEAIPLAKSVSIEIERKKL